MGSGREVSHFDEILNSLIDPRIRHLRDAVWKDKDEDQEQLQEPTRKGHLKDCLCAKWDEERLEPDELIRELVRRSEELIINKNDEVDLEQLLFTRKRGYLTKSHGQKVYKDTFLKNKYVLLYIFPLGNHFKIRAVKRELKGLRNLLLKEGFEIVSVGLSSGADLKEDIEEYVYNADWPFIPYWDSESRELVRSTFGFSEKFVKNEFGHFYPYLGIVGPDRTIMQEWAWEMFNYFGHDLFPFTDEHIISLFTKEASMFTEGLSLQGLLGTDRDYLLSPNGDQVPIQNLNLEDKVVCIILDHPAHYPVKHMFKRAFDVARLNVHPGFFPVYVCRHFTTTYIHGDYCEKQERIGACSNVDWHRVPCEGSSARKIWRVILRVCRREAAAHNTICNVVGPGGKYVNFLPLSVIEEYGTTAYPFTVQKLKELESLESIKVALQLEDVLQPYRHVIGNPESISVPKPFVYIKRNGIWVQDTSFLKKRRLLVLFGTHSCCELGQFLRELKLLYEQNKETDEEFEVIYISFDCALSDFVKSTSSMPWVVFHYRCVTAKVRSKLDGVFSDRWSNKIPAITAFENGALVGMEGDLHLKKDKPVAFPYVHSLADESFRMSRFNIGPIEKNHCFWSRF